MGLNPSEVDLRAIIKDITAHTRGAGVIDFPAFLTVMAKQRNDSKDEKEIREIFKFIDKEGSGVVSAADLRHVLTTIGEKVCVNFYNLLIFCVLLIPRPSHNRANFCGF